MCGTLRADVVENVQRKDVLFIMQDIFPNLSSVETSVFAVHRGEMGKINADG